MARCKLDVQLVTCVSQMQEKLSDFKAENQLLGQLLKDLKVSIWFVIQVHHLHVLRKAWNPLKPLTPCLSARQECHCCWVCSYGLCV